ncbi:RcnB family protein [Acinetobacter rudis]|uniref:Nickel/cobalt transporter regulator n=1 Tax=Acinetobacter rudis CIP 110305 TaxID=421052 RepID=S3MSA8_9GAMM|nr:RcnB family protein [Acinetobacter rudis]EPF69408.1 hypothetical protein F945_03679 [Acinetobacter rudis CIP 110305]
MNKLLVVSAVILNLLLVNQISYADPGHGHKREYRDREARSNFQGNEDDDNLQEKRRLREERGLRRLQQHQWQPGYVMPQHYRGNGYKVDYREQNLPKPAQNQQWYKINNDYILIDSDSNNIIKIQGL